MDLHQQFSLKYSDDVHHNRRRICVERPAFARPHPGGVRRAGVTRSAPHSSAAARGAVRPAAPPPGSRLAREGLLSRESVSGSWTHSQRASKHILHTLVGEEKAMYRSAHHSRATAFGVNSGGGRSHRAGRRRWKGLLRPDGFSRRRVPLARRGVSVWRGIDWALRLERTKPQ